MKFQNQEKGLFTFYREQQLFEDHIENLKKQKEKPEPENLPKGQSPKTMKNVVQREKLINNISLTSEPGVESEHRLEEKRKVRYKKFGEAVMIVNRKNTEQSSKKGKEDLRQKEMGSYLENKFIELDHKHSLSKEHERSQSKTKKMYNRKREEYLRVKHEIRASTRLPSLCKIEQPDPRRSPTEAKHKINGSLIRSVGNDILKEIRVRAQRETGLQKKSVSYFEFNRDYQNEKERKISSLSMQQKKLLQILNRYRKYDH